ncbi:hypothetical protein MKW98_006582 [Papaver atlanticum]|uniref:Uncharacterized protein n=1 Tax=Papaver atlanticum TaxID=357466 RepID=A0AAD4XTY6_9MAGN|nr:hypothetical protein MKW98_006582 [Papaver atlanticum]
MEIEQNGEHGEHYNTLATATAAPKERKVLRDTTLASFMGKRQKKKKDTVAKDWLWGELQMRQLKGS